MSQAEVPAPDGVPSHEVLAGTPSALDDALTRDALDTVELGAVLGLVAGHAAGELAAERVRRRRPVADVAWIRNELARVGEVAALVRRGDALRAEPVPDLTRALARLRIDGSVLEGVELARIRVMLAAARAVRDDLVRLREALPLAQGLVAELPPRNSGKRLEQSLDDDGNVLDAASPALAAARREVHAARQRLVRRLESVLRSLEAGSDATVTVRGGRYVIPVRRDLRSRPGGIIHDESSSHGTLFIEPSEAVEFGNALREAEIAEERETLRVLRELTEMLRPELPALRACFEMCLAVDELVARAKYAVSTAGEVPAVASAPAPLQVVNGRHPLLLGAGGDVVPFELSLEQGERTLLVSGPNTGGKTVLLKAVALFAAMVQCGVVPPVGPGSRIPVFSRFAADIGDRQSIAASLSTFSAHVRTLGAILDDADDATLVLLDEVGSGTDPAEGAALAAAALVSLTRRGTVTLATTHLGSLKTLAAHEPGIVNGSLQFDAATLTPTYRFVKGVPGRSYGLAIARRLGLPAGVVADAETRVPEAERGLDQLLATVEERQQAVERQREETERLRLQSEELAARLAVQREAQDARDAELRRREKEAERRAREQSRAFLLEARARVEAALGAARQAADDAAAREARRTLEDAIRAEGDALSAGEAPAASGGPDAGALERGQRVRTAAGAVGEVLEIRGDGKVVVRAGAMKLVVDPRTLTAVQGARGPARSEPVRVDQAAPEADLEIDLRGLTGDEAESATLAAVDRAVLAEQPYLRIIHGMGTGVVRERVRRIVSADRRIKSFAFAPRNLGGTGVTIVEFD
ncbi:MAG TPA: Smr/MutS family protein [Gemmatimonadales bacterium]